MTKRNFDYRILDEDVCVEVEFDGERPVEVIVYEKEYDEFNPILTRALAEKIANAILREMGYDILLIDNDEDNYSFILERYHFLVEEFPF